MHYKQLPKWQRIMLPAVLMIVIVRFLVANELVDTRKQLEALERTHEGTLEQLAEERMRATVAEKEVEVVRKANELLRASERDRQDDAAALEADLAFYRRLGGASGSQAPLAVHYIELQATAAPHVFRVIFTLTQNLRWAAVIAGNVELGIEGILDGAAKTLTQDDLLDTTAEPMDFRFKYFQQIERLVTLPAGFEPSRLSIRLKSNSLRAPVEQSMSWQSLFKNAPGSDAEQESGSDPATG